MGERPFAAAFLCSIFVVVGFWRLGWIEIPTFTHLNTGLLLLAGGVCLMNYVNEYHGLFQLSYSKFSAATTGLINARAGWSVTYALPAVIYATLWHFHGKPQTTFHLVALVSYVAHFVKRILECCFVHKYSRDIEIASVIQIGGFYSLGAVVQHYWCNVYTTTIMGLQLSVNQQIVMVGMIVCAIGEFGNLYHHMILASLRPKGVAAGTYMVPSGGLFGMVICPHYFSELMAWLGMAIAGQHLALYMSWLAMVAYLAGRSHQTRLWYVKKIENFPQERWNLYPGIY